MKYAALGITAGSMAFTSYFGWTAGGDILWACFVGAVVGALISLISPLLWFSVGLNSQHAVRASILGVFAGLFLIIDAITNVGSLFSMRQAEIVGSKYQTELAGDARNEVSRLEKRISEIRSQAAWQTKYLEPSAYDSLIEAARLIRDNEAKRGGCGPLCEEKTRELAELEANKANALGREALKKEMDRLESDLVEAKAQVHDTPPQVSAAWTQVEKLAALATLNIDPAQDTKEATYLIITGLLGLITSVGAAVLSWALGCSPTQGSGLRNHHAPVSQSPYLPNYTGTPRQFVPQSSHSRETTIVVPGGYATGNAAERLAQIRDSLNRTMANLEAA